MMHIQSHKSMSLKNCYSNTRVHHLTHRYTYLSLRVLYSGLSCTLNSPIWQLREKVGLFEYQALQRFRSAASWMWNGWNNTRSHRTLPSSSASSSTLGEGNTVYVCVCVCVCVCVRVCMCKRLKWALKSLALTRTLQVHIHIWQLKVVKTTSKKVCVS